jgi:hypothetical protein
MAAALKERCSREVISRNEAIEALKRENETLESEKARRKLRTFLRPDRRLRL